MSTSEKDESHFEVCFVEKNDLPDEASIDMKSAYEYMISLDFDPVWIRNEECLKIFKRSSKIFVTDQFEGKVFDHLKSLRCRIIGPLCILFCLQHGDALPKRPYPIYSVAMRKLTVCCSNVDSEKRSDIRKKVELMGGIFSKDFTENVTHLVVDEVGSEKYREASRLGIPVMVTDWITDMWESAQHQKLHAASKSFRKYQCPIFKGLTITVSQLSVDERDLIKSIVEEHGGTYSSSLKHLETTHLVLSEPTGDKYCFARKWNVHCVGLKWICESVEAGYCKGESSYELRAENPRGGDDKLDVSCSTDRSSISQLDETCIPGMLTQSLSRDKAVTLAPLDDFDLSTLPKNGQYLDGCKIFLTGFSPPHLDKLRKVVNSGGGMRFSKYSDSISHVVCGEVSAEFSRLLSNSLVKPYVVNFNWLLECCKNETLVDEKPFLCMDVSSLSPEKNEVVQEVIRPFTTFRSNSQPIGEVIMNDCFGDIFQQYQRKHNGDELCGMRENSENKPKEPFKVEIVEKPVFENARKCLSDFNSAVIKTATRPRKTVCRQLSNDASLPDKFIVKNMPRKRKSLSSNQTCSSKAKLTRGSAEF